MGLLLRLTQEMIKPLTDDMPNKLALRNKSPMAWSSRCCGQASLILFWGHLRILLVRLKIVNCAIKQSDKSVTQSVVKRI